VDCASPGFYGPRQNYDFLNPYFRQHAERVFARSSAASRIILLYRLSDRQRNIPNGVPTQYTNAAFSNAKTKIQNCRRDELSWGLVYWGQLVDKWEDLPPRNGILNPGYKLEWENVSSTTS